MQNRAISIEEIRKMLYEYFNQSAMNEYGEMDYDNMTMICDILMGENNQIFCLYKTAGMYYQSDVSMTDGMIELSNQKEVFNSLPVQIRITKQENGKYRGFGIAGTSTLNRIGVFDSKKLFDKFVERYNPEHPPYYTLVHGKEFFRIGSIDWFDRYDNTLLFSWEFDDTELAERARISINDDPDYWGNSIGFHSEKEAITKSKDDKIRTMYVEGDLIEVSLLPEKYAAHYLTSIISEKETRMALPNELALRETLSKLGYSPDRIEDMVKSANQTNRMIEDNQMEVRVKAEETHAQELELQETKTEEIQKEEKQVEKETNSNSQISQDFEIEIGEEVVRTIQSTIEANFTAKLNEMQERIVKLETANEALSLTISGLQTRVNGVQQDISEQVQEIVQDLPAKAKTKGKVVFKPRSLVDDKNTGALNILPDTTKEGWAKELALQTRQNKSL